MMHILPTVRPLSGFGLLAACCAGAVVVLFAAAAHADRVYSFNSYPSEQDGGSLTGSITVVDSAPDNGLLSSGEVVSWNWTAVNGPLLIAADSMEENALLDASNVQITETHILIPSDAMLVVGAENDNIGASFLNYSRQTPQLYAASRNQLFAWLASPADDALGGDPWVVATIVPEPDTATLAVSALAAIGLMLVWRGWPRQLVVGVRNGQEGRSWASR